MRVLITGGAGFIGSNFVYFLLKTSPDVKITVVDSLTYAGNLENISRAINEKRIIFCRADITKSDELDGVFAGGGFDQIYHFAAESHVDRSIHSANEFVNTNVVGTQNLLNYALAAGKTRFIHVSTDEVYGSLGPHGFFHETTPLSPTSPYAASKAASDLMVLACHKTHGLDAVVTRCTNNYGPYQFPEKLIPLFVTNALEDKTLPLYGDGKNVRSWLFVNDHCEALLLAGERGGSGEVYNIGPDPDGEKENIEVTTEVLTLLKKPKSLIKMVSDRPAHDRRYAVDNTKIKQELGWKPRTEFNQGLKQTVDWYIHNREWWQHIKSGDYLKYYENNYAGR